MIRYIYNFGECYNKKILIYNSYFLILNISFSISLMKLIFHEGYLTPIEEYLNIQIENCSENQHINSKNIENIFDNNNNIILFGKYIYLLKGKDDNNIENH